MPEYHVGWGIYGIYAGVVNKKGDMWLRKSVVTNEAIDAVISHMYFQIPEGEKAYACAVKLKNGKYARLKLEVSDICPEWAKEILEGVQDGKD